ncbi:MAG: hypothetical protein ABSG26_23465 [Bryobacteraceae bacterium]
MHCHHRSNQVAVGGDKKGGVDPVFERVLHQLNRDVHIGHLLVRDLVDEPAVAAREGIELVSAVENGDVGEGMQGVQVRGLTLHLVRWKTYAGGEILRVHESLARLQQIASEGLNVEPQVPFPTLRLKAEIQVETVDVCDNPSHGKSLVDIDLSPYRAYAEDEQPQR